MRKFYFFFCTIRTIDAFGDIKIVNTVFAYAIFSIKKLLKDPPAIVRNLVRPFLAAACMGLLTYLSLQGLKALGIDSRLILCALPVMVGVVVYCVAAVKLKVVTRSDCLLLPKGAKIAKLLKL